MLSTLLPNQTPLAAHNLHHDGRIFGRTVMLSRPIADDTVDTDNSPGRFDRVPKLGWIGAGLFDRGGDDVKGIPIINS